jgi:hypothetical protein
MTLACDPETVELLLRGRFLLSLLELAGTAKFPTGGILASFRFWGVWLSAASSAAFAAAAALA